VFFSYAAVTPTSATLYVDAVKLTQDVRSHLGDKVQIEPYEAIFEDTKAMAKDLEKETTDADKPNKKFMISTKASWALSLNLGGEDKADEIRSPVGDAKAIKNATELEGMRQCHIRDGAALSEYFAWLEEELLVKKSKLDEVQGVDKNHEFRTKREHFVGLSFDTISSTGPNAAVIHYKPEPGNCSIIDPTKIYLCDSGAQYLDGTTDTTRTMHFGTPTDMERKAYTLVLKGVIALDTAVFPKGTSGFAIDAFARQFLWKEGLDYRHGTGHGVGSYLNVHEGPIGIGTRVQFSEVPLSAGNVLSDEPGYYDDGNFGIRIENMFMVKEVETKHRFGDKPYFGFEHVTMVPMCQKLMDVGLLTEGEREWVNGYHREVMEKIGGLVDERAKRWLERETKAI
jgi:Xaa-Pro aminopeptidase